MDEKTGFEEWAIVELFGRQVIAGKVTEQVIGGGALIRVDVPETEQEPAFTKFFGQGAIYSIMPVSEAVARLAVKQFRTDPITVYIPGLKQLAAGKVVVREYSDRDGDGDSIDDDDEDNADFDPDEDMTDYP